MRPHTANEDTILNNYRKHNNVHADVYKVKNSLFKSAIVNVSIKYRAALRGARLPHGMILKF